MSRTGPVVMVVSVALSTSIVATSTTASLHLASHRSGERPAHRLTFDIRAGDPEIFRAEVTYPHDFRFTGFHTLGPVNTAVGAYELDLDFDGMAERTLPLIALSADSAYIDLLADRRFSPATDPLFRHAGATRFELTLPFGGDANADTVVARFAARVSLVLFEGLLVNPSLGGTYRIAATLATVDPDSDGAGDGIGTEPVVSRFEIPVRIAGPSIAKASLLVDRFDLKVDRHRRYRFSVHGRFALGRSSDGVALAREKVTVVLDWVEYRLPRCAASRPGCVNESGHSGLPVPTNGRWFSQTIPGSAFAAGHGRHYTGDGPGIEKFRLWPDGRFQIDAGDLTLMHVGRVAAFTLRIGNDQGTAIVTVDKRDRW